MTLNAVEGGETRRNKPVDVCLRVFPSSTSIHHNEPSCPEENGRVVFQSVHVRCVTDVGRSWKTALVNTPGCTNPLHPPVAVGEVVGKEEGEGGGITPTNIWRQRTSEEIRN